MTTTDDVTAQPEFEALVALLDDEYARDVLVATSREPMTVKELSDVSEASQSTLYGRVERLLDADILAERTRIRSDGHHDTEYVATLQSVQISLADGQFEFAVERADEDAVDRLHRLWRDL